MYARAALASCLILASVPFAVPVAVARTSPQQVQALREAIVADPERGLAGARDSEAAARAKGDHMGAIVARGLQAEANLRLGRNAEAERLIDDALAKLGGTRGKLHGDLLITRGALYAERLDVAKALADYQEAHRSYVAAGEARSQALALISIGSLYQEGADYRSALRYYDDALEAFDGDRTLSISIFNNRGNAYSGLERYREAAQQLEIALRLAREAGQPALEGRILANLAMQYVVAGDRTHAQRLIDEARRLIRRTGDDMGLSRKLDGVAARLALAQGDAAGARVLIERAFAGVDLSDTSLSDRDNHLVAYRLYRELGLPARALLHLDALKRLDDDASEVAISTKTALMSARFNYQNQELRIARLKADELRSNVELERSRARFQQIIFGGVTLAVAVLIALLSFGLVTIRRSRNRVREANTDLARTNAALEKALAAKTEFLATTSHEIRTPLNGILGMTQVMLADPALDARVRERIGVVHGAGATMRALVDDILDVAKMETGQVVVETAPVDLRATLTEATRLWEAQADGRGLRFAVEMDAALPARIETDPARLRQILFNLLSNALKFTEQGGVTVRVGAEGARLRIAVADTGIGIPADKHGQVFESFQQVDAGTSRRYGGTGLGLTICRNLARALGGDLTVTSEEGAGSTFLLDLPLNAVAVPERAGAASVCAEGETRPTVVVLERNPIARGMLRTLFEQHSAAACFAATLEEAEIAVAGPNVMSLLIDHAAVVAIGSDTDATIARMAAAARAAAVRLVLLWPAPDDATDAHLRGLGVTQIVPKPARGAALIAAAFVAFGSNGEGSGLVSKAA